PPDHAAALPRRGTRRRTRPAAARSARRGALPAARAARRNASVLAQLCPQRQRGRPPPRRAPPDGPLPAPPAGRGLRRTTPGPGGAVRDADRAARPGTAPAAGLTAPAGPAGGSLPGGPFVEHRHEGRGHQREGGVVVAG